jgi:hypothetical protein
MRYSLSRVAVRATLAGLARVATASADPSTPRTLTYHLTDCVGPAGTPSTMDGVKQPGQAAAIHLTNGLGDFVFGRLSTR